MNKHIPLTLCLALLCAPAQAASIHNSNFAQFNNNAELNASALGAIISSSHVIFQPEMSSSYAGNTVATGAFDHAFGIMAVNQNTGINSIAQQTVTVRMNNVSLPAIP